MIGYMHDHNRINKIDKNPLVVTDMKRKENKTHQLNVDEIFRVIDVLFQLKQEKETLIDNMWRRLKKKRDK